MKRIFFSTLLCTVLLNAGCASFSGIGTDNNPKPTALTTFTPALKIQQVWSVKTGAGTADNYVKLAPAYAQGSIFSVDHAGLVTASRTDNGQQIWQVDTKNTLTSSPAVKHGLVIIGSQEGVVIALNAKTGQPAWRTTVPGTILAPATITSSYAYIKTLDGNVCALEIQSGKLIWLAQHQTPVLILRGSSAPQVSGDTLIVGFADGKLVAYDKLTGAQRWERAIIMPQGSSIAERMVDIDVDPQIKNGIVYVATYQGNIAALNADDGSLLWEHPLSSYTGLTNDENGLYVADAKSRIWAFTAKNGQVLWRQNKLFGRHITGPVIMNGALVVGDNEGYLHWLALDDGHFLARIQFDKSGIIANPLLIDNTLYVTTVNGYLAAYRSHP